MFGCVRKGEHLNAVEIEEAISQLADQPFDPKNFPYSFLEAFGNKETTIKRLRAGASNKSILAAFSRPTTFTSVYATRVRLPRH